jgi:hypothetical protein
MFIEIVGDNGTAIRVNCPSNSMRQNTFNMVEAKANGAGCTGILIDGVSGGNSQRFWGLNLDQFRTTINVATGESNIFECNYVAGKTADTANRMFVCGINSFNNTFSAQRVNVEASGTQKVIEDNNTTSNAPNIFERIRIQNNTGGTVTYTKTASTVLRDITAFNSGNALPAGLLQYPLSAFPAGRSGTVTLTAGAATVTTSLVTANSQIFLTAQNTGGTPGTLRVSARTAGTSFTITSSSGTDTSLVAWMIVEPA